jgi:uncharacterized membrane protein
MQHFEYSIDVNIPVRVAYEQWIRFEEFPSFMPTVKHVVQRDDKTLDVTSTLAAMRADWTAEITDQLLSLFSNSLLSFLSVLTFLE